MDILEIIFSLSAGCVLMAYVGYAVVLAVVAARGVSTIRPPNSLLTRILPVMPVSGSGSSAITAGGGAGEAGVAGATRLPPQAAASIAAAATTQCAS